MVRELMLARVRHDRDQALEESQRVKDKRPRPIAPRLAQFPEHLAVAPDREPRLGESGSRDVAAKFLQALPIMTIDLRRGVQREAMGLVAERVRSGDRHMRGCCGGGMVAQRLDRAARLGAERYL